MKKSDDTWDTQYQIEDKVIKKPLNDRTLSCSYYLFCVISVCLTGTPPLSLLYLAVVSACACGCSDPAR